MSRLARAAAGLLAVAAAALAYGAPAATAAKKPIAKPLDGTFLIERGNLVEGEVVGSYFRIRQADGEFVVNPTSSATDETYTFLAPGADGGLVTGEYQRPSGRAFDAEGNSRAGAIIEPTFFDGVELGLASLPKYPAGAKRSDAPWFTTKAGKLYGRLAALTAGWSKRLFNQGAPKPGRTKPVAVGTYDKRTGRYTLRWTSKISGGPYDGATGIWRLEGEFEPA